MLNISSMSGENKNARMASYGSSKAAVNHLTRNIAMLHHTPIKRLGEAEDIARAALFLCSPAASWISGQLLAVSGGGVQELD